MNRSIITRLCLLVAAVFLFMGATGCLDKTPFPKLSDGTQENYALEYQMGEMKLLVKFQPQTDIYDSANSIPSFSAEISSCFIKTFSQDGASSGESFSGDCNELLSDDAKNGNTIALSFTIPEDRVVSCNVYCNAQIEVTVTISGVDPSNNQPFEQQVPFVGPYVKQCIEIPFPFPPSDCEEGEPEYLNLASAAVTEGCGEHEVWNSATSSCDCAIGYSRASASDPCLRDEELLGPVDTTDEAVPSTQTQRGSLADLFGDGTCTLNPHAVSGSNFGILSLLLVLSMMLLHRPWRKKK